MLTTAKQIHEVAKEIMSREYDYDYVGLRIQESDYGLMVDQEVSYESKIWIDGDETDGSIGGICAVDAEQAARRVLTFGAYSGNVIIVVGSNRAEHGEDDGELILMDSYGSNPIVLDIIRL